MKSVLDSVLTHAAERGDRLCVRLVSGDAKRHGAARTFAEVAEGAARAAGALAAKGVGQGDLVVLIGTHDLDFYAVWLGATWLGAVPTVLAEPSVRVDKAIYWARLEALLGRIDARLVATGSKVELDATTLGGFSHASYRELAEATAGTRPARVEPSPESLLLLQHSSGTTGLQKGVMLTHGAVMRHAASFEKSLTFRDDDVVASWLPLYHDMGLIACFVTPLIAGLPVVWLSPFEWVARPSLLLSAVSEHRATLAWLPNFAYPFLAQRTREPPGTFSLASLRAVVNCSEPVDQASMEAFAKRFEGDGLRREALHTCYAMAENVFAVTASTPAAPPKAVALDAGVWREEHRAAPAAADRPAITQLSSGVAVPDCEVRIADAEGRQLENGQAGRVLLRSSFGFSGYFRRDAASEQQLDAEGFYDTGDVGWLDDDGHLFVTGRLKDLVIVGGRNVYPLDVEQLVGEVPGVYPGRVVCFGAPLRDLGTEGLVVLAESSEPEEAWDAVLSRIRATVPSRLDLDLADARVVPRGSLRKSTSGKLARAGNREWYLAGRFGNLPSRIGPSEESPR